MSTLQIGLMVAVVVLLVAWLLLRRSSSSTSEQAIADRLDTVIGWPPKAARILNSRESTALAALTQGLPECIVLAQVPLSRFVSVPKRNSYAEWLRRIGNQCADFVVCDSGAQVIAVVELQALEFSERSQKRLQRMTRTLEAAQIPLHLWREDNLPTPAQLRQAILPRQPSSPGAPTAPEPELSANAAALTAGLEPILGRNPFDELERDSSQDEMIELLEPRPSTWFDEFDTKPSPLAKR